MTCEDEAIDIASGVVALLQMHVCAAIKIVQFYKRSEVFISEFHMG